MRYTVWRKDTDPTPEVPKRMPPFVPCQVCGTKGELERFYMADDFDELGRVKLLLMERCLDCGALELAENRKVRS